MTPSASRLLLDSLTSVFRLLKWVTALAALAVLVSGITVVKPDEVALRLRFGKLTGQTRAEQVHGPGLLIALPYLIDEVIRVPVKRVQELGIDTLTGGGEAGGDRWTYGHRVRATADHNIVQPRAVLKYQIIDPEAWALRVAAPERVIHDAVVSALTRTLGETTVERSSSKARSSWRLRPSGAPKRGWIRRDLGAATRPGVHGSPAATGGGAGLRCRPERVRRAEDPGRPGAELSGAGVAGAAGTPRTRSERPRPTRPPASPRLAAPRRHFSRSRRNTAAVPPWCGSGCIARR